MPFNSFGEAIQYAHDRAYWARKAVVVLLDWVSKRMWAFVGPHPPYLKLDRHQVWITVSPSGEVDRGKVSRQDVLYLLTGKFITVEDAERLLG